MIAVCPTIDAIAGRPVSIFVGGCVERGDGSRFRAQAHAHTGKSDEHRGWICVLGRRRLGAYVDAAGDADVIVLTGHGHDDVWRAKMRELGQPLPLQYRRDQRGMHRHRWRLVRVGDGWRHHTCAVCGAYKGTRG